MASPRSPLIIPVENQFREFDAKLLLSCIAAERGFPVVMGSRALLHYEVSTIDRGVYLAKSLRSLSERMFGILRNLGHDIVAWDEEALVHLSDTRFYYRRRLSSTTIRQVSALLAWGAENQDLFLKYPDYNGVPVHVTGNPRTDMMRSELRGYFADEVADLHARFGRFVLINTNFGWSNHFLERFRMDQPAGLPKNEFETGLAAHKRSLFEGFKQMVPALAAALPEFTVLVRPHPTEDHALWKSLAAGHPNVKVANDGNVVPWLMACQALVHVGCTTGVEAAVLGVPAVAYQPVRSDRFDDQLPNQLSYSTSTLDELLETVCEIARDEAGPANTAEQAELLGQHVAALDGPLASERILKVLEDMGYPEQRPPKPALGRYLLGRAQNRLRTASKKINMRRRGHRNSIEFHDHRFPPIDLEDVRQRVGRLQEQLGRFGSVQVEQLSENIFRLEG
jgi:surface carbohydrate biosynthesis protein